MGFLPSVCTCVWEKKRFKKNSCCLGGFTYIAVPDARNQRIHQISLPIHRKQKKRNRQTKLQISNATQDHNNNSRLTTPWMRPHEWACDYCSFPQTSQSKSIMLFRAQTPKTKPSSLVDKKWHTRVSSTQTESFQNKLIINGWQERLLASSGNFLALTCTKTRPKREKPEMVMQQQPKLGGINNNNNNNNTTQSTKTKNT